jgi:hypothetical protein
MYLETVTKTENNDFFHLHDAPLRGKLASRQVREGSLKPSL